MREPGLFADVADAVLVCRVGEHVVRLSHAFVAEELHRGFAKRRPEAKLKATGRDACRLCDLADCNGVAGVIANKPDGAADMRVACRRQIGLEQRADIAGLAFQEVLDELLFDEDLCVQVASPEDRALV